MFLVLLFLRLKIVPLQSIILSGEPLKRPEEHHDEATSPNLGLLSTGSEIRIQDYRSESRTISANDTYRSGTTNTNLGLAVDNVKRLNNPLEDETLQELLRQYTDTSIPLADRCLEADGLDGSGNKHTTTSPYYRKRRIQMALVNEIWRKFFPHEPMLLDTEIKRFLGFCDSSTELLYDEIEDIANISKETKEGIKTKASRYVRTSLENRKAERENPSPRVQRTQPPRSQASQTVSQESSPSSAPPKAISEYELITKGDDITAEKLHKPSEEERQKMREYSKKYAYLFEEPEKRPQLLQKPSQQTTSVLSSNSRRTIPFADNQQDKQDIAHNKKLENLPF